MGVKKGNRLKGTLTKKWSRNKGLHSEHHREKAGEKRI